MAKSTYQEWVSEVKDVLLGLKKKIDQNEIAQSLYGGFYIWDSKYIENPEIMFIGINPGNGNPNNSGEVNVEPQEQMSYMEFLDGENNSYTLARETVDVFRMAGYSEQEVRELLNEKSVKTNLFYLITSTQKDIEKCINQLPEYSYADYGKKSCEWTSRLIGIMNPRIIICEGKRVFDIVTDCDEIVELKWENDCGFCITEGRRIIIGYSRLYSNIKNKQAVVELIKRFVKVA